MHIVHSLRCSSEVDVCYQIDEIILMYSVVGILYTSMNVFKPCSTTFVRSVVSCYSQVEYDMDDSIDNLTEDWRTIIHIKHIQNCLV